MTATDDLRRLLDERGVEWEPSVWDAQHETFYSVENGVGFIVTEFPEIGRMSLACDMRITPEQAIDATLGRGTCRMEHLWSDDIDGVCWWCKACDKPVFTHGGFPPNYCPNCGRRVVDG